MFKTSRFPSVIVIYLLLFILILSALLFRLPGYSYRPFWIDELWRVNLFINPNVLHRYIHFSDPQTSITSPVYLFLNKFISLIDISPISLRLSSLAPSLIATLLSFFCLRESKANVVVAFFIALFFATNSQFMKYSNELKPYMFEVLIHVFLMYLWLKVISKTNFDKKYYPSLFIALCFAIFSAANIVFILPSVYISILYINKNNRDLIFYICKFGIIPSTISVLFAYIFLWSQGANDGMLDFWKEGFPSANDNNLPWTFNKIIEIIDNAFLFSTGVIPSRKYWLFVFVSMALIIFFKRQLLNLRLLKLIIIFYLPMLLILIFLNQMKVWPLGNLRPNLFIFAHIFLFTGLLFAAFNKFRFITLLVGIGLSLFIFGLFQTNTSALKYYSPPLEEHTKVWNQFAAQSESGLLIEQECNENNEAVIFFSPSMSYAFKYHVKQDEMDKTFPSVLTYACIKAITVSVDIYTNHSAFQTLIEKYRNSNQPFWFLYSFIDETESEKIKDFLKTQGTIERESAFINAGLFRIVN